MSDVPEITEEGKRQFAARVLAKMEGLREDQLNWFDALLSAALDETHGDLEKSFDRASAAFDQDPDGGLEK